MKKGRGILVFVGLVGVLWGAVPGYGQEPAQAPPAVTEPDFMKPDTAPTFPVVRVVLTLGIILGGLYFVRPWLKKMKWAGVPSSGGNGLDVVARAYLGPRAGVCMIQANGKRFLVGVGADGVRLLADLGAVCVGAPEESRG